jgi:hypothetical protein
MLVHSAFATLRGHIQRDRLHISTHNRNVAQVLLVPSKLQASDATFDTSLPSPQKGKWNRSLADLANADGFTLQCALTDKENAFSYEVGREKRNSSLRC